MKLDQQPELLADAVRATSEYYHITPVYIEKDYWISKILQQLSLSIYADSTVFKDTRIAGADCAGTDK